MRLDPLQAQGRGAREWPHVAPAPACAMLWAHTWTHKVDSLCAGVG